MQTKPKANSIVTTALSADGTAIEWKVRGAGPAGTDAGFELRLDAVSEANKRRAMLHGFVQRITDKAAMARSTVTGMAAAPIDKYNAMKALAEHYGSGSADWSPARAEGAVGLDSITLAAVVEATGKTTEEVRSMIDAGAAKAGVKPSAYLAALGSSKLVAPIVARIRGEQAGIDGDDLLADMMGEES